MSDQQNKNLTFGQKCQSSNWIPLAKFAASPTEADLSALRQSSQIWCSACVRNWLIFMPSLPFLLAWNVVNVTANPPYLPEPVSCLIDPLQRLHVNVLWVILNFLNRERRSG